MLEILNSVWNMTSVEILNSIGIMNSVGKLDYVELVIVVWIVGK